MPCDFNQISSHDSCASKNRRELKCSSPCANFAANSRSGAANREDRAWLRFADSSRRDLDLALKTRHNNRLSFAETERRAERERRSATRSGYRTTYPR